MSVSTRKRSRGVPAMTSRTLSQTVLAVSAILLAFGLGFLVRERLTASTRLAHKAAEKDSEQRLDLVLWSTGDELWEMDMARDTFTRTNPLNQAFAPILSIDAFDTCP